MITLDEAEVISILNQLFEIDKKLKGSNLERSISRNLQRLGTPFYTAGFKIHNPIGEAYDLTRLDCEARIVGEETENLIITEVIKPIIYLLDNGANRIIQNGVVIVAHQTAK